MTSNNTANIARMKFVQQRYIFVSGRADDTSREQMT